MRNPGCPRPDVAALVVAWLPGWSVDGRVPSTPGFRLSTPLFSLALSSCWSAPWTGDGAAARQGNGVDPTLPIIQARSAATRTCPLQLQLCRCACWCAARGGRCNRDRIGPSQGIRGGMLRDLFPHLTTFAHLPGAAPRSQSFLLTAHLDKHQASGLERRAAWG
jgi:hypothetical protein